MIIKENTGSWSRWGVERRVSWGIAASLVVSVGLWGCPASKNGAGETARPGELKGPRAACVSRISGEARWGVVGAPGTRLDRGACLPPKAKVQAGPETRALLAMSGGEIGRAHV